MEWSYDGALDGNVALTGEVDLAAQGDFILALGFGTNDAEVGQRALSSLYSDYDVIKEQYLHSWRGW